MIEQAVTILRQGGVIAYPTEAVYGLGCDPQQPGAVKRILELKQRPADKGLILVAADFTQLEPWLLPLSAEVRQRVLGSWPGPLTWLCPVQEHVSSLLRGQHASLAVRVSDHPVIKELCTVFGGAIISTSANRRDAPPARTAQEVREIFSDSIDMVVEGALGDIDRPTEIRDALTNAIIRPA